MTKIDSQSRINAITGS